MANISDVRAFLETQADLRRGPGAVQADLDELAGNWGGSLPDDYEAFLREFGWVEFGAQEVPGIGPSVPGHLNVLSMAHDAWRSGVPRELLPFFDSNGDWLYCLSRVHENPVVMWSHECGESQPYDEQYASWSEWFMEHFT